MERDLHIVRKKLTVIEFDKGRLTEYGREYAKWIGDMLIPRGLVAASLTDYAAKAILDHTFNDAAFSAPTPYLGLWTSALTDASTGSTAGEAAYTGYARKQIAGSDMGAASGTGACSKTNSGGAITFDACTAGSAVVTYWGICDALTVGNMIWWGTCTSTTVDTSHTPATVSANALTVTLD